MASFRRLSVLRRQLCPKTSQGRANALVNAGVMRHNSCAAAEKDETVLTETDGNIFLIGLNRPEQCNAVNRETALQLRNAFEKFNNDKQLSVAVFHGSGGNFCSGYDLKELASFGEFNMTEINLDSAGPMGPSKMRLSKPVIAAVSGYAVAGGLELALMCDMRVAEESAIFGVFCRRFGVPLIDGGTVRLPKLIGLSRALDMILTGRPVNAQEALSFGLVNRVVPNGKALESAVILAKQIASFPQGCMQTDRRSAFYSTYDSHSMADALKYEFKTGSEVLSSESVPGATRFAHGQGRGGTFDSRN